MPFLEHAEERTLREVAFRAWTARGSGQGAGGTATDNLPLAAEILALRPDGVLLSNGPGDPEPVAEYASDTVRALLG
ncbi:MAG: hypothetical protein ABGW90_07470, partial [Martelella sp.]